jgi:hypothetical protein
MKRYKLYTSRNNVIKNDTIEEILKEILKIISEGNGLYDISYSEKYKAIELSFEGYYCDFSLLMRTTDE